MPMLVLVRLVAGALLLLNGAALTPAYLAASGSGTGLASAPPPHGASQVRPTSLPR